MIPPPIPSSSFYRTPSQLNGRKLCLLFSSYHDDLPGLEAELTRAVTAKCPAAIKGVTQRLLAAVRDRPEGTLVMVISDGTEAEEDYEEAE